MAPKYRVKKQPDWKKKQPPYQIGVDGFTWYDLKKSYTGWTDPKMFLPLIYDLVLMQTPRKTIKGWWNGIEWEGLRLLPQDNVSSWKYEE